MIKKILIFLLVPALFLAIVLSVAGVTRIDFGDDVYPFLKNVFRSYEEWKLEIPNIPKIPKVIVNTGTDNSSILSVLIGILNFLISFVNGIISVINFVISVVNIGIQLVQFFMTFIYKIKDFIAYIVGLS